MFIYSMTAIFAIFSLSLLALYFYLKKRRENSIPVYPAIASDVRFKKKIEPRFWLNKKARPTIEKLKQGDSSLSIVEVFGDSMEEKGLHNGDWILIKKIDDINALEKGQSLLVLYVSNNDLPNCGQFKIRVFHSICEDKDYIQTYRFKDGDNEIHMSEPHKESDIAGYVVETIKATNAKAIKDSYLLR